MKTIKTTKAIAIARVSEESQATEDRKSLPVQLERILEYAKKYSFEVIGKPIQIVESAHKPDRPKFLKALEQGVRIAEESKETMAFLLFDIDRFSRDISSQIMQEAERLRKAGKVEFHFVQDNLVISKATKAMQMMWWKQRVLFAEMESTIKSEKVKQAILYKLKRGEFPSWPTTGYLNDPINKTIVPDPERSTGIKKMFELYSTGDYSAEEVAKILANQRMTMKPQKGAKPRLIAKGDVVKLLSRRIYSGDFDWPHPETGEVETWKGNYESIISKALFNKVQKVLDERAIKYSAKHYSTTKFFKYRGLLTCGFCGMALTPQDVSKNYGAEPGTNVVYRCSYGKKNSKVNWYEDTYGSEGHSGVTFRKKRMKGKKGKYTFAKEAETIVNCPQLYVSESFINEAVKEQLKALTMDKETFKKIKEELAVNFEERMSGLELEKTRYQIDLKEKETELKGLIRKQASMEDTKTATYWKDVLDDLADEIETIKEKLEDLNDVELTNTNEIANVLTLCADLHEKFDSLNQPLQRQLVLTAFRRITVRKGFVGKDKFNSVDIAWTEPFWLLHEKWFNKVAKEDGAAPKGGGGKSGSTKVSVNKNQSRAPDRVGRRGCIEHDYTKG